MATQCTCGADGGAQSKKLLKRRTSKKGERENPYSERGVEKFSALLAEIQEKKRMIYSKFNPEEVSLIRFVHAGDNKLKPVVVRANSNKLASKRKELETSEAAEEEKPLEDAGDQEKQKEIVEPGADNEEEKSLSMEAKIQGTKINQPWMSNQQVSVVVILGLVLLVGVLGRYWKSYYLLQLQATVCPRIQTD